MHCFVVRRVEYKAFFFGDSQQVQVGIVPCDNSALLIDNLDIAVPCAVGGFNAVNPDTISEIKAKYVVGTANNYWMMN